MPEEYYLSIVIPCYKEEKRIHKILDAIIQYEKNHNFAIEVIVVVDGSPDDTAGAANKFKGRIPNLIIIDRSENKGKGYTVKEGVLKARGKYVLFADADNSTPVEQVDKLLKYAPSHEVVIGSRYCEGGKLAVPQPPVRLVGTRVLNLIIRILAVGGISDTQCGFKLFKQEAGKEIFRRQTLERFSFDIEVLAIAKILGYQIKEVGITWYDDPHSTVNPIKDGIAFIKNSWQIRKNRLKGIYK